ncbi:hypothetical protein [Bacillus cereus group sp. BfR-BA-01347]|uniref:AbiTii domain-containing protein n=1 Tax=Bacillus cereus group sp. BfR-BA-01347 TaxID=2920310 RepID=UPI001F587521|nr:hypothetical protein [Bacillus cereus group sp. BfR-BA-01347]
MARSQLLKDTVSGQETIENVLLRLKIILSDLENDLIMQWIEGELTGYEDKAELPNYRMTEGLVMGTYVLNNRVQLTNQSVPLHHLISDDEIKKLINIPILDSFKTLERVINNEGKETYASVVPASYCHGISNIQIQILQMRVECPQNILSKIISNVKSKLVEVIMELENQYDDLDELDIKSQVEKDTRKKEQVIINIENIIFDESIKMGDRNKVEGSRLGHGGLR